MCVIAMVTFNELPYFWGLAPSDFFFFLNLRKLLDGKRFGPTTRFLLKLTPLFKTLINPIIWKESRNKENVERS